MQEPVVIVSAARTAMGGLLGHFKDLPASTLGAAVIEACIQRAKLAPEQIAEVFMGCVLPAGQGQAPARQAALGAKLPYSTGATTINKMCGSGMKAVMFAHDLLHVHTNSIFIAGGMESMSNAPYLIPKARTGYRLGHGQIIDHMFYDGLEDAYDRGRLMGTFAEATAQHYKFTREAQDEFAITSLKRAQKATQEGYFKAEIVPVTVQDKKETRVIDIDQQPAEAKIDKIPHLKPAFAKEGTVTAANSSSISDGAAALLLMRQSTADSLKLKPLATITGHATHAQEPAWFTTAPIVAIQKLLAQLNWSTNQVDLFEINEAFATVTMAAMRDLELSHDIVNVHGGACALGHPIGASGARILVTLLHALQQRQLKRGVASLCIGGGEATAVGIELVD
ncbi:MAG: acetyl-CoA C-acetyltransferase [Gammaproteobacteria bacterium]